MFGGGGVVKPGKMICHYEVMELPSRTVSIEDIKKQYKKLALKWHPDRNYGQEEMATDMFKKVSAAYAVLSDPQERKWYDDHRDSILRGGDGTSRGTGTNSGGSSGLSEDVNVEDLWHYFNTSCFSGYEDNASGKGFYQVYGGIFQAMVAQEDEASEHLSDAPPFGNSSSSPADVNQFYNYWLNFVTSLSFSWEDEYNPADAPNRQVRRAIEKENKKARDAGRKKYIDIVRALVAYVRKRDPRMEAIEAEYQRRRDEDIERRKKAQLDEQTRRAEARQRRMETGGEGDEAERIRRAEERKGAFLLAEEDDSGSDSDCEEDIWGERVSKSKSGRRRTRNSGRRGYRNDEESDGDGSEGAAAAIEAVEAEELAPDEVIIYSCEVCKKDFKTCAQLEQHCQSKVHRKNAKDLEKSVKGKAGRAKTSATTKTAPTVLKQAFVESDDSCSGSGSSIEDGEQEKAVGVFLAQSQLDQDHDESTSEDDDDEDVLEALRDLKLSSKDKADNVAAKGRTAKIKAKRGGKTSAGKVAAADEEVEEASVVEGFGDFVCGECSKRFITRNLLFLHVKKEGHAVPMAAAANTATQESPAKKPKRKAAIGGR